jgi:hypothetical protein
MTDAIENVMKWAAADRNVTADTEDAWLIIHVVGALIVRLLGAAGG